MTNKDTTINELMEFMQEYMATKEDLKGFATKDDLERFVTKDDLDRFATKDDLERFATKDDLDKFATKKDLRVMQHEIFDHVDNKLSDFKGDLVALMRMEADKVGEIISVLKNKRVLNVEEAKKLLSMQPFPRQIS